VLFRSVPEVHTLNKDGKSGATLIIAAIFRGQTPSDADETDEGRRFSRNDDKTENILLQQRMAKMTAGAAGANASGVT
jgi:hypothetical protein